MGAMTEAVLETAISYSSACEAGIVIHISTGTELLELLAGIQKLSFFAVNILLLYPIVSGGNLRNSLLHGKVQTQRYPALADMDANNRLKGIHANNKNRLYQNSLERTENEAQVIKTIAI